MIEGKKWHPAAGVPLNRNWHFLQSSPKTFSFVKQTQVSMSQLKNITNVTSLKILDCENVLVSRWGS